MANPQSENGHTDIANELLEQLSKIVLSPNEWRLLMVIFRITYGWHKREDKISLSQFVKKTGIKKANIVKALRRLDQRNVVIVDHTTKPTTYRFQKNYENWCSVCSNIPASKSIQKMRKRVYSSIPEMVCLSITKPVCPTIPTKENKEKKERTSSNSHFSSKMKTYYPDEALSDEEKAQRFADREANKEKARSQVEQLRRQGMM